VLSTPTALGGRLSSSAADADVAADSASLPSTAARLPVRTPSRQQQQHGAEPSSRMLSPHTAEVVRQFLAEKSAAGPSFAARMRAATPSHDASDGDGDDDWSDVGAQMKRPGTAPAAAASPFRYLGGGRWKLQ
jgi:hypothetical protein